MTEVVEVESIVNTIVVEGDSSPSSVVVEVVEGQALVDNEPVGAAVAVVEVVEAPVAAVEIEGVDAPSVIEVDRGTTGPPGSTGPQGPPGKDGAGTYYEEFSFATPSTTWLITHGLNSYAVNVETVDTSGQSLEGTVTFLDLNTVEVDWYYPTAGAARVFR